MGKKTIVFDFDGVIHRYSKGWQDGTIYDIPTEGIKETIEGLRNEYKVVVVSTRSATEEGKMEIKKWLQEWKIEVDDVLSEKPPALIYVDDRAINFNGNCQTLLRDIRKFKSWTEKANKKCAFCGNNFFDSTNNKKYCSVECRVSANIKKELEKK